MLVQATVTKYHQLRDLLTTDLILKVSEAGSSRSGGQSGRVLDEEFLLRLQMPVFSV